MSQPQPPSSSLGPSLDADLARVTRSRYPMLVGFAVIVFGLGGFLAWAYYAPLGEGVPAPALVSIDTKRKPVQHLTGGLITEVLVREGDMVEAGQVVARLDAAASTASLEVERRTYEAKLAMIENLKVQKRNQRDKQQILQQQLEGLRGLVAEGYAPRNQQLELERALADTKIALTDIDGAMSRTTVELPASLGKIKALEEELERTELRAPVAGQVVGLTVQSPGAVIRSADKLMDIVPSGESLLLETRVNPAMIDRVSPGQTVDVRFSGFAHSPALVVEGRIESLSHDLVVESTPNGQVSYYLARVAITAAGNETLGARQMQPGMQAEVIIKTGERSVLTYLLHPLTKRLAASMTEE